MTDDVDDTADWLGDRQPPQLSPWAPPATNSRTVTSACPTCGTITARDTYDIGDGPELSCDVCEWCWGADGQPLTPIGPGSSRVWCVDCQHTHVGPALGGICIGCPCPNRPGTAPAQTDPAAGPGR